MDLLLDYSKETKEIQQAFWNYMIHAGLYVDHMIERQVEFNKLLRRVEDNANYSHPNDIVVSGLDKDVLAG